MSKKKNRVGEMHTNKRGETFVVIEYNSYTSVVVESTEPHHCRVKLSYDKIKSGDITTPFCRKVCGVGYLGLMSDGVKPRVVINGATRREYKLWQNMIDRCYSNRFPSYKDCTVCERWQCFANFLEDLPSIENYDLWLENKETYELDKDIKQQYIKDKVYSLENCIFVKSSENTTESGMRHAKDSGKNIGVHAYNLETKELLYFKSVGQAVKELNVKKNGIEKCLYGQGENSKKRKTAYGYKWIKSSEIEDFKRENSIE